MPNPGELWARTRITIQSAVRFLTKDKLGTGTLLLILGCVALLAPVFDSTEPEQTVGVALAISGVLELLHSFRLVKREAQRAVYVSGGITILLGILMINSPFLAKGSLILFVVGAFLTHGIQSAFAARRSGKDRALRKRQIGIALGNAAGIVSVLFVRVFFPALTVGIAGSLRIFGTAWSVATSQTHGASDAGGSVARDAGLPDTPEIEALAKAVSREEEDRRPIDRGWIGVFLLLLFAIHMGRMQADWTMVGMFSPFVALFGDVVIALLLAFGVVVPLSLLVRRILRRRMARLWKRVLSAKESRRGPSWRTRLLRHFLIRRFRFWVRLRQARYSGRVALERGLQIGLPLAAILTATIPIWGMNWYFDTENWAAGVYNSWAEQSVDRWREAMVRAATSPSGPGSQDLDVSPPGVSGDESFSFLVIGDPGEGDESQQVLRDRITIEGARDEVRFLVISSDVIYPTGAMRDYESKFWLPFKGFTKPVYAIPGNHDWYDANEGFNATFLEPDAARAAMRARVEADHNLTSTTDKRIDSLIDRAALLRKEYEIPTGFQRAPYFQMQTSRFALIALDTGVAKRLDPDQLAWFEAALERARGKFIMVVLGHPFYAGGADQTDGFHEFADLRDLLRRHGVQIAMAGDTHDLEYYKEPPGADGRPSMPLYFVNGGGGAYLSLGTSLSWPASPATPTWAIYPSRDNVVGKVGGLTAWWKRPMWLWTDYCDAWPFSSEWLSAAFDYNAAPFFQSFIEVSVEPSARRVRLIPCGVHGRLRWRDFQSSPDLLPGGASPDDSAEFVVPMP